MEQNEIKEQTASQDKTRRDIAAVTPSQGDVVGAPPTNEVPCPTCAAGAASMPASYVYAIGRVEPRFPRLSVEKEFAQATGRAETAGLTDQEALHKVLSERQNRYLVKQLCWVLTIEGLQTYILQPRDPADFDLLVEALRPAPRPTDVDVVIGLRGPIAPPELCNGLMVPIVVFNQIILSILIHSSNPSRDRKRFPKRSLRRRRRKSLCGSCRWPTMRVPQMSIVR